MGKYLAITEPQKRVVSLNREMQSSGIERTILMITEVGTHSVANCEQLFRMTQQFCGQRVYHLLQITLVHVHRNVVKICSGVFLVLGNVICLVLMGLTLYVLIFQ